MEKEIRAVLFHLGGNMWCDWAAPDADPKKLGRRQPATRVTCDETIWRQATELAAAKDFNMVVIDLGEGMAYPSHPELAVEGSWSPDRIRAEVARLKSIGLEAIPKLNFSNTHNGWLKEYRRMVSTPDYYKVCEDVIRDAAEAFGRPRFMHLGYDEETFSHQTGFDFSVVRQGELWWHDFLWFVKTVEAADARPWVWSDYGWHHPEYVTRCPKSVLQSNWYYDELMEGFEVEKMKHHKPLVQLFYDLEKAGFEQVPCGSNWNSNYRRQHGPKKNESMRELMAFCRRVISPKLLKGFMMATWARCDNAENLAKIREGLDLVADASR